MLNHRPSSKFKISFLGLAICFLLVGTGIGNPFTTIAFMQNNFSPLAPVTANISPIEEYLFQTQNFTYFLNNACHSSGGFPGKGSDIENTWYAARLMQLLNNYSQFDLDAIADFIKYHQCQDGGFTFEDDRQNGTLLESYRAVNTLELISRPLGSLNLDELKNFLNSSVVNQTYFRKSLDVNDTSIETNYAGLQLADALGVTLESMSLNQTRLWELILADFENFQSENDYGFFYEPTQSRYTSTYYALQCLGYLNKLEENRSISPSIQVILTTGNLLEGSNSSINAIDTNQVLIGSEGSTENEVNVTFAISLDNFLDDGQETFGFCLSMNCSEDPVQNASLLLFNILNQTWENMTESVALQAKDETTFYVQTAMLNTSSYLIYDSNNFTQEIEARVHVKAIAPFNLSVNYFQTNFTVFNKTRVADVVNNSFSVLGGYFDFDSIAENDFALEILNFMNFTNNPLVNNSAQIRDFVLGFSAQDGLFTGSIIANVTYLDVTLASTFYSNNILNRTGFLNYTIGNQSLRYMLDWIMPDDGFSGAASLSLSHTYYYVEYLHQTNSLTSDIRNRVRNFTFRCQLNSGSMEHLFVDNFEATSMASDTFYSLKILNLVDDLNNVPHLLDIGAYFIDAQVAEGYFFLNGFTEDIYFALNIISLTGTSEPLKDVTALISYINSQQDGSGGFSQQHNGHTRVKSTSQLLEAAKKVNILSNLKLYSDGVSAPGAIEYLCLHQNASTGGFWEVQDDLFGEPNEKADIGTTYITICSLDATNLITDVDEINLLSYVSASIPYFNDLNPLENITEEKFSYVQGSLDRIQIYISYGILAHWKLRLSVDVNYRTAIVGIPVEINLNLSDPFDNLLEGGLVGIFQDSLGVGWSLKDHQNGTYSCELTSYPNSGVYNITIWCNHSDYIGYSQKFWLTINDIFSEDSLGLIHNPLLMFSSSTNFSIHLVNSSGGSAITGAIVQILDSSNTLAFMLEDSGSTGVYAATLDFNALMVGNYEYTLIIQKTGFRTETYSIVFSIYPAWFMIIILAMVAVGIIFCIYLVRRRVRVREVLRRAKAKLLGKKIGFQQMQAGKSPKSSGSDKEEKNGEKSPKKGGLDYA